VALNAEEALVLWMKSSLRPPAQRRRSLNSVQCSARSVAAHRTLRLPPSISATSISKSARRRVADEAMRDCEITQVYVLASGGGENVAEAVD